MNIYEKYKNIMCKLFLFQFDIYYLINFIHYLPWLYTVVLSSFFNIISNMFLLFVF